MKKEGKNISRRKFLNSAAMATAGVAAIGSMAYDAPGALAAPGFIRRRQTGETLSALDEIQDAVAFRGDAGGDGRPDERREKRSDRFEGTLGPALHEPGQVRDRFRLDEIELAVQESAF